MPDPLEIDVNEPLYIEQALALVVPCERRPLNANGEADYAWNRHDGLRSENERKTWHELVSNVNNVERQLSVYLKRPNTHVTLLMEGIAIPVPGGTRTYRLAGRKSKALALEQTTRAVGIQMYYAWLHQVSRYVEVQCTADQTATAYALSAFYKSDQKPDEEHRTFRRYLRKRPEWHENPQVSMLLSLSASAKLGIGEARAEELIGTFGTLWNIMSASPWQLATAEGVTEAAAKKFLRAIGRPDV